MEQKSYSKAYKDNREVKSESWIINLTLTQLTKIQIKCNFWQLETRRVFIIMRVRNILATVWDVSLSSQLSMKVKAWVGIDRQHYSCLIFVSKIKGNYFWFIFSSLCSGRIFHGMYNWSRRDEKPSAKCLYSFKDLFLVMPFTSNIATSSKWIQYELE